MAADHAVGFADLLTEREWGTDMAEMLANVVELVLKVK